MENKADILDRASEIAQSATDEAVQAVRRAAAPEQDPDNLDPCCVSCGDEIEPGRLKLLKKRCLSCQSAFERNNAQYANRNAGASWGDRYV